MRNVLCAVLVLVLLVGLVFANTKNVVVPYILRAPEPITVDGVLDEWGFAFPLVHNQTSIPDSSRFRANNWLPATAEDCSGTIYMMYDDDYLYFAAHVKDDAPGHFSEVIWASDCIEIYMANWDVGDALFPAIPDGDTTPDDPVTGHYAIQLNIAFDESLDSVRVWEFYQLSGAINSPETEVTYVIWDDGMGYTLEGKIYLLDLQSPTTGNKFEFTPGTRIPMTWSLYDIDETESSADFQGFAYTPKGYAGWMGVGPGWQVCDVMEVPRGKNWNNHATFDFVHPFIKRVADNRPVVLDGELDEWNFVFPLDHWQTTIPDSGRFRIDANWIPEDALDCHGTIYMMYDDEYLYLAAYVVDDAPGHFSDAIWASDCIEFYAGTWDIGDLLHPEVPSDGGWPNNASTGDYSIQLNVSFDESLDSVRVHEFYGVGATISSDQTQVVYKIWEDGWYRTGYTLEGKIALADLQSPSTGNDFVFTEGFRLPMTWSLYDIDESESSADFQGFAYTPAGYAGWMGIGAGWQYADVKGVSLLEYIDQVYPNLTSIGDNHATIVPTQFQLGQNYPNPFNPTTNIRFTLDKTSKVSLKVYNVSGQLIKTILDNETRNAGAYDVQVDLSNVSSGVYFTVLSDGQQSQSRKMMLLK